MGGEFAQGVSGTTTQAWTGTLKNSNATAASAAWWGYQPALSPIPGPAFYSDARADGFEWLDADSAHLSIFAYRRKATDLAPAVLVICNFTPVLREDYRLERA